MEANGHFAVVDGAITLATAVAPFDVDSREVVDPDRAALLAELERERERNRRLQAIVEEKERSQTLTLKVSEKGALSIYGLGRFPLTAYKEQWLKILAIADHIKAFISANDSKLTSKK